MKKTKKIFLFLLMFAMMISLISAVSADPVPEITNNPYHEEVFVGDDFEFNLTFNNNGNETGYVPYVHVFVPKEINITAASFYRQSVYLTHIGTFSASNNYTIYDDVLEENITRDSSYNGYKLYSMQYPITGLTIEAPDSIINIVGVLSPDAPIRELLTIETIPYFLLGKLFIDIENETDPVIVGGMSKKTVLPVEIKITKSSPLGGLNTPSGPNFNFTYTVTVDVAPGVTAYDLVIDDYINDKLRYVNGTFRIWINGAYAVEGVDYTITGIPDGRANGGKMALTFLNPIVGTDSSSEIRFNYLVYGPEFHTDENGDETSEYVINRIGETERFSNAAYLNATIGKTSDGIRLYNTTTNDTDWMGLVSIGIHHNANHTGTVIPGDVLEYIVQFQVSDYFAFDGVHAYITVGRADIDGKEIVVDENVMGELVYKNLTYHFNMSNSNYVRYVNTENGTTLLLIDVSAVLRDLVPVNNMTGGLWDNLTAGDPGVNTGKAVGQVTFVAKVSNKVKTNHTNIYTIDTSAGGNATNLNGGNTIVLSEFPKSYSFPLIEVFKYIYALNGNTNVNQNEIQVEAGDEVTFAINIQVPAGLTDYILIRDYLPSYLFNNVGNLAMNPTGQGTITSGVPTSGNWGYLTDDRLIDSHGNVATPTIAFGDQAFIFNFTDTLQNVDVPTMRNVTLLYTFTVTDGKMIDGFTMANRASVEWGYSVGGIDFTQTAAFNTILQPELTIEKRANQTYGIENGTKVKYSITVKNVGQASAYNIAIVDSFVEWRGQFGTISNVYISYNNGTNRTLTPTEVAALFDTDAGFVVSQLYNHDKVVKSNYTLADGFVIYYTVTFNANPTPLQWIPNLANITSFYSSATGTVNHVAPKSKYSSGEAVQAKGVDLDKKFWKSNDTTNGFLTIGETGIFNITVEMPLLFTEDLVIQDLLPAGLQYVGHTIIDPYNVVPSPVVSNNGQTITFSWSGTKVYPNNPNQRTFTLLIYFKVVNTAANPVTPTTYARTNTANATWTGLSYRVAPVTADVSIRQPGLTITNTFGKSQMYGDDTNNITITVRNTGASTAYNVTITDDLSVFVNAGFVINWAAITAAGGTITYNPVTGLLSVHFAKLDVNQQISIFIPFVSHEVYIGSTYVNTANAVFYSLNYTNADNRRYTGSQAATLLTEGGAVKKIVSSMTVHTVSQGFVTIGEYITYNITVTLEQGVYEDITIWDVLPAGFKYSSHTIVSSVSALPSPTVTTTGGLKIVYGGITNITNGKQTFYILITALVEDVPANAVTNAAGVTKTNTAIITWKHTAKNFTSTANIQLREPILTITKDFTPNTIGGGDNFNLTITVTNGGGSEAYNITVTDDLKKFLDDGFVINGVSSTMGTATYNAATGVITVKLNSLAVNGNFKIIVSMTAQSIYVGKTYWNVATATYSSLSSGTEKRDYNKNSNNATLRTTGGTIAKTIAATTYGGTGVATIGEIVTYQIAISLTQGVYQNLVIEDTLPAGLTYNSQYAVNLGSNVLNPGGYTVTNNNGKITITFNGIVTVNGNTNNLINIRFNTTVANTVNKGDVLSNKANMTWNANLVNHTTTPVVITVVEPKLDVVKSVNVTDVGANDKVQYNITIKNTGNSAAYTIVLTDVLPQGLIYSNAVPSLSGWTVNYNPGSRTLTVTGKILNPGEVFTLLLNVAIDPDGSSILDFNLVNLATVTYDSTNITTKRNYTEEDNVTISISSSDLGITKTNLTEIVAGQNITYQLVISNKGPQTAINVVLTENLPSTLSNIWYKIGNGAWTQGTTNTLVLALGNITMGSNVVVLINATLASSAVGNLINHAIVNSSSVENNDSDNEVTLINNITVRAQLDLTLISNATIYGEGYLQYVYAGDNILYTLTIVNGGPSDAVNVNIFNYLPPVLEGVTYSIDGGQTWMTWSALATVPSLAALGNITVLIKGKVNDNARGYLNHTANFTTDTTYTGVNTGIVLTDILVLDNLSVEKTANETNVIPGQWINYIIEIINSGISGTNNINIADALNPTYFNAAGATYQLFIDGTLINSGAWTGSYAVGNISSKTNITLIIKVQIKDVLPPGITTPGILNTVFVTTTDAPYSLNDSVTINLNIVDLQVVETPSNPTPNYHEYIDYVIVVTNNGPGDATDVVLNHVLPAGLQLVHSNVTTGTFNSATGVWNIGNLANGAQATLTLKLRVLETGVIIDFSNVTSPEYDFNLLNNNDSIILNVPPAADITLTKNASNGTPLYQEIVYYTIKIINHGPDNATGVIVLDRLPEGLVFISYNATKGTYDHTTGIWNVSTLAVHEEATIVIEVYVNKTGPIVNNANVSHNEYDENLTPNHRDGSQLDVPPAADIKATGNSSNPAPNYLDEVEYTITVTNLGPDNGTSVYLDGVLPEGLVYISHNAEVGTFNSTTGYWDIGDLASGKSVVLTVKYLVNKTGFIGINLTSAGNETDVNLSNNNATINIDVPLASILIVNKTVNVERIVIGSTIIFTIIVTNYGPDNATGVYVVDLLPAGMKFVSFSADVGTYDPITGLWTVGNLTVGESVMMNLSVIVTKAGVLINEASAFSDNYNPDKTGGNIDSANVTVFTLPQEASAADGKISMAKTGNPIVIILLTLVSVLILPLRRRN